MQMSRELAEWLRQSQLGTSLFTRLPEDCREGRCHLCDLSLDAVNDLVPCLHWLVGPYLKREDRIRKVFELFQVSDVMRYLVIWTLSRAVKQSAKRLVCTGGPGMADIRLYSQRRNWRLQVEGEHAAVFGYLNVQTGVGFVLPLALGDGEASTLRCLTQFSTGGQSTRESPQHAVRRAIRDEVFTNCGTFAFG